MNAIASAATMTIVVFFEDSTIGALARDRIAALASKHPSRVVVLDATADRALSRAETEDWIEVGVKAADAGALVSAVDAWRLREAPVVLLWIARGIGNDERFCALSPQAQTIVYNSSLVGDGGEALGEFAAYAGRHPELALADIAYLRLAPWQESVALFFDGPNAAELDDVRHVEVSCGSDPEGLYLLGWLASRLKWTPEAAGEMRDRSGEPIAIAIRREGEPRRIRRVALSSSRAAFLAEVDESGTSIVLSVTGAGGHPQRFRAVNNPGIAALVERAILAGHHDRVFVEALAAAGEILARRSKAP